jgi:hypothetical protein
MKNAAGLWIDHSKAVIVIVSDKGEETKQLESSMEKHVREDLKQTVPATKDSQLVHDEPALILSQSF